MTERDTEEKSSALVRRSFHRRMSGSFSRLLLRKLKRMADGLASERFVYLLELTLVCVIVWLLLTIHQPAPFYAELPSQVDGK